MSETADRGPSTLLSNFLHCIVAGTLGASLVFAILGCSEKESAALYGKWTQQSVTMVSPNGSRIEQPGSKVIEFRKGGIYLEGEKNARIGKFKIVDPEHLHIEIDGLSGDPKIVLQSDTLDICNPDGSTTERYKRLQ